MTDDRAGRLAAAISRIAGPTTWLARVATVAAGCSVPPALIVWWAVAGDDLGDRWRRTIGAVLVLVVFLLPAAWLVNVRVALTSLVALPGALEVARRRGGEVRNRRIDRPEGGLFGTVRAIRSLVQDYSDVVGGWALVVQLVSPVFWLLTGLAFLAVPVLGFAALVTLVFGLL